MRDPFDTGPVLRLGEAKATAPDQKLDSLQVDVSKLTMVEIASLVGNSRYETHPNHRPPLDLFTVAFGPRGVPAILSESEFKAQLHANHEFLITQKYPIQILEEEDDAE